MSDVGGGLLDRPDDMPSEQEEKVIEKLSRSDRTAYDKIEFALTNSIARCFGYSHKLALLDVRMERRVQDRLLDNLLVLKPKIRQMPLEEALARAEACSA